MRSKVRTSVSLDKFAFAFFQDIQLFLAGKSLKYCTSLEFLARRGDSDITRYVDVGWYGDMDNFNMHITNEFMDFVWTNLYLQNLLGVSLYIYVHLSRLSWCERQGFRLQLRVFHGESVSDLRLFAGEDAFGGWAQHATGERIPGWWFGTFFIFPYIEKKNPNWQIFFRRDWKHQPGVFRTAFSIGFC